MTRSALVKSVVGYKSAPHQPAVRVASGPRCARPAPRPVWPNGAGRIDNPCDQFHFYSPHPGGANFLYADTSVHFLSYAVTNDVARKLATMSGEEMVELP
jgi:prepilin-type processing-associated H-X9-DG protein